jgi:Plavaka transposase
MAFCNRLMFHAQWEILLDDELRHAMKHGIVIKCHDGVERRFYPRIFTYSADYPEKWAILFLHPAIFFLIADPRVH